jgi:hypothetical protein
MSLKSSQRSIDGLASASDSVILGTNLSVLDENGNIQTVLNSSHITPRIPDIIENDYSTLNDMENNIKIAQLIPDNLPGIIENEEIDGIERNSIMIPEIFDQSIDEKNFIEIPPIIETKEEISLTNCEDVNIQGNSNQVLYKKMDNTFAFKDISLSDIDSNLTASISVSNQIFVNNSSTENEFVSPSGLLPDILATVPDQVPNSFFHINDQGNFTFKTIDLPDPSASLQLEKHKPHHTEKDLPIYAFVNPAEKIYLLDIIKRMSNGFLGNNFSNIRIDNSLDGTVTKNKIANEDLTENIQETQNILSFPENDDILIYHGKNLVNGEPGYFRNFNLQHFTNSMTNTKESRMGKPVWDIVGVDVGDNSNLNDASTIAKVLKYFFGASLFNLGNIDTSSTTYTLNQFTIDSHSIIGEINTNLSTQETNLNSMMSYLFGSNYQVGNTFSQSSPPSIAGLYKSDLDYILLQLYGLTYTDVQNAETTALTLKGGDIKTLLDQRHTSLNTLLTTLFGIDIDTTTSTVIGGQLKTDLDTVFTSLVGFNYTQASLGSSNTLNILPSSKIGIVLNKIFDEIFGVDLASINSSISNSNSITMTSGTLFDMFEVEKGYLTTDRNNFFLQTTNLNTMMIALFGHSITATAPLSITTGLFHDTFEAKFNTQINLINALYNKLEDYTTLDHWTIDSDANEITSTVNCVNIGSVEAGLGDINNKLNETRFPFLRKKTPYWSNMWAFELNDVHVTDSSYFHFNYSHTGEFNNRTPFTIAHNGKIGINNDMPYYALHIKDSADVIIRMEADSNNSGEDDNPQIWMSQDDNLTDMKIGLIGNANTIYQGSKDNFGYASTNNGFQIATQGDCKMTLDSNEIKYGDAENQNSYGWVTNRHSFIKSTANASNLYHNASSSNSWVINNPNDLNYNYHPKQNDIVAGLTYDGQGSWKQPSVIHNVSTYTETGTWFNRSRSYNIAHGSSLIFKAGNIQNSGDNGSGLSGTCFGYGGDIELIPGVARVGGDAAKTNSYNHRSGSIRMFVRGRGQSSNYTTDDPELKKEMFTLDYKGWLALGKLGVNPDCPLEVMHYPLSANGNQYAWFNQYSWYVDGDYDHSYEPMITGRFEYGLAAQYLLLRSDERIKTQIELVDDRKALDIINKIESYEYHYKDPSKKNENKTIGFVAQQVKEYLPNAVSYEKNYIPDQLKILENLEWIDEKILVINDLVWNKTDTGKIKFIVCNNPDTDTDTEPKYKNNGIELKINCIIDENGEKTNKFSFDKKWDHVLIHGKEISDFNIIDKNMIYALHHSAIQELSRENIILKDENVILKDKIAVLEEKMKDVMTVMLKLDL